MEEIILAVLIILIFVLIFIIYYKIKSNNETVKQQTQIQTETETETEILPQTQPQPDDAIDVRDDMPNIINGLILHFMGDTPDVLTDRIEIIDDQETNNENNDQDIDESQDNKNVNEDVNNITENDNKNTTDVNDKLVKINKHYENIKETNIDKDDIHNPEINLALAKKYDRLVELCPIQLHTLDAYTRTDIINNILQQITELADKKLKDKIKKEIVCIVLDKIKEQHTIYSFTKNPVREDDILSYVYLYINSKNSPLKEQYEELLITALLDCMPKKQPSMRMLDIFMDENENTTEITNRLRARIFKKYQLVCINGRTARLLSLFTLLDDDEILQSPIIDYSIIANEAYVKTSTLIKNVISSNKYDFANEENKFVEDMKELIEYELTKDYKGFLTEKQLSELILKAQSGI